MNEHDRDLLIAWSLLPFLTPNRTRLLREFFEPLGAVRRASSATIQGLLRIGAAEAELVRDPLRGPFGAKVPELRPGAVTLADDDYPPLLLETPDPPLALHCRGRRELLKATSLAVVGSRRASHYALNATREIVSPLAKKGLAIVSGLARGIDAAAHEAALDAGGTTIAVLGTGIDRVYPRSHARLFRRIEADGLVISEFPPGTPPLPENFPVRNRIISGLTLGTLVVEASARSGSLITARLAAEQGRDVFAVPGPIFSPGSEGTHRLIQYGAKLVHDVNDVLDELPGFDRCTPEKAPLPDSPLREVLEALSREEAVHIDEAARKAGTTTPAMAEALLQLELEGWVRALPGAKYLRLR